MKGAPSRHVAPPQKDGTERRTAPGPRSKAIFDREAEVMAPGLQSIALYSQIAVDRARGCTIYDVDGTSISTLLPALRWAASATAIPTM